MENLGQQDIERQAIIIAKLAAEAGDVSSFLEDSDIARITSEVIQNYDLDKQSREEWEKVAKKGLSDMAQTRDGTAKDYPFKGASDVHYPLLPYAVMQFNARAYPAIVKGDEAVSIKVVGADKGMPQIGPDGRPLMQFQGAPVGIGAQGPVVITPAGPLPLPEGAEPEQVWKRAPGAKTKRATRVKDYMNTVLFYRMNDWEGETDTLLFQLPAVGCGFRKMWYNKQDDKQCSSFVSAMHLVVNDSVKTLKDAPQITEEIHGVYPHQIKRDIKQGKYREVDYLDDEKESRMLLEQQCYFDLDEDGLDEPYIVTVDHKDQKLLRIVPNFGIDDIRVTDNKISYIERAEYYVKYEFLPHPEGKFYNIGLAHLLEQYGEVINTIVNQMIDSNHAATAGGGFIGSGVRIQGQGQSSSLKFRPGEYKTVPVSGQELRNGIYERTFPGVSPVMFQLLELILGASKEIASIKDVLSGDASNNGQVGTTLALIEQGLQVFTAIYKRVYRGLKSEYQMLFENIGKFANDNTKAEYFELLDDPEADFDQDFNQSDMDIRPVSDPSNVTKMQKMSRAQFLLSTMEQTIALGGDGKEIMRRVYDAADIEDVDKIFPEQQANPMQQMAQQMEIAEKDATIKEKQSKAKLNMATAAEKQSGTILDAEKLILQKDKDEIDAVTKGIEIASAA